LPKRFYILFVARGEDGQLRKIPIPVHYLYVLAIGALVGVLGLTGLASSYVRMLLKVSSYNELRAEREDLKHRYNNLEQVAKERDIQVASLGSLASEVSSLYGLKPDPELIKAAASDHVENPQVSSSLDRLYTLRSAALSGATSVGISLGLTHNVTAADWTGASFRGEGLGLPDAYGPASFTPERAGRAVRAGVAAVLNGITGVVIHLH